MRDGSFECFLGRRETERGFHALQAESSGNSGCWLVMNGRPYTDIRHNHEAQSLVPLSSLIRPLPTSHHPTVHRTTIGNSQNLAIIATFDSIVNPRSSHDDLSPNSPPTPPTNPTSHHVRIASVRYTTFLHVHSTCLSKHTITVVLRWS